MENHDLNNLLDTLRDSNYAYHAAVSRNSGVAARKTYLMNILFNNLSTIIENLAKVSAAEAQAQSLTEALAEADAEYRDLHAKYKALLEAAEKPARVKKAKQGA